VAPVDASILHALNGFLVRHDGVEDPLVAYVNLAEALFLGMLVLAFLLAGGHRRVATRRAAVAAGLSAGLGLAAAQVLSRLVDRPRPFVAHPDAVHLFARHAADPGFPSDHATAAFAIGVALFLRRRAWGAAVLVAATVLAVGRVAMGVHYPTDVIGGAALGALAALALYSRPVRELANRLADLAGRVPDRILQGILHPQDSPPV
jgi:undecaprenyl-diphosphatase